MTKEVVLCGNLDQCRPSRGTARDLASEADGCVDFRSFGGSELVLGHGPRDGELVNVVELERHSRVAPDPTSQHEHGDSVEISFGNPRERVCQSCSGNYVHCRT